MASERSNEDLREAKHELVITRVFDAPRELVWRAWTDPEMGMRWAAPPMFPVVALEQDVRPGGQWRKCLRGCPPGTDIPVDVWQTGIYREVVPPELLVYSYAWESPNTIGMDDNYDSVVTVRLEEIGGKTTMHFSQAFFKTEEKRDNHGKGWSAGFDRLEQLLKAV